MIKTRILLIVCILNISYWSSAQNVHGNVGTESSNSADASKGSTGGQVTNLDLYTGTASVNIPIHGFTLNGLNAGVSLNYVAKGIRVDEVSSSVGLGWQLSAGGSITREVNGLEDEVTLPAYFKAGPSIPPSDSGEIDWMNGKLAYEANAHTTTPGYEFNKDDSESDLFHVNMLGRSFSFSMKRNPTNDPLKVDEIVAYTKPHSDIKIEVESEFWDPTLTTLNTILPGIPNSKSGWNVHEGILRFRITDEKGNVFLFTRGDYQTKEYNVDSVNLFNNAKGTYYATQKWNLVSVNTYSGQSFGFTYEQAPVKHLENITEAFYQGHLEVLNFTDSTVIYDPLNIKEIYWEGVKSHIKSITYPNGTYVNFVIHNDTSITNLSRVDQPGDWILDKIEIQQGFNNKNTRKITFDLKHAYFNTPAYGDSSIERPYTNLKVAATSGMTFPTQGHDSIRDVHQTRGMRLMLKEIKRIGFDNTTTKGYYTFGYMDIPLPYRFSPHKDYYGFYNGKDPIPYIRDNFFWTPGSTRFAQFDTFYLSIPYHFEINNTYNGYDGNYNPYWGLDRNNDSVFAQACVLNEITNEYGGTETLYYKSYSLSNADCGYGFHVRPWCGNDSIACGNDTLAEGKNVLDGLCLGATLNNNKFHSSHNTHTEYFYENGQRFYQGVHTYYMPNENDTVRTNYLVSPHDFYNGSNHGFSNVRAITSGPFGTVMLSDTRYEFSNLMYYDASYPYNGHMRSNLFKVPAVDYWTMPGHLDKHKMGLPLKVIEYDKDGVEISRHESTYTEVYDTGAYASTNWVYSVRYASGPCFGSQGGVSFGHYIIDDKRMLKTSEYFSRRANVLGSSAFINMLTIFDYQYDEFDNIKLITWYDSKGDQYKKYKHYNYDWPSMFASDAVNDLTDDNRQFLLSQEGWKMNGVSDSTLIDYSLAAPSYSAGIVKFPAKFSLVNNQAIPASTASTSGQLIGFGNGAINVQNALNFETNDNYGTKILKEKEYTLMNGSGDVLEHRLNDQEIYASTIYETVGRKSAAALNARHEDIAFTSFEVGTGNWYFDMNDTLHTAGNAMTGSHVFNLIKDDNDINSFILDSMDYVVALWAKSSVLPKAQRITPAGTLAIVLNHQNTVGEWKLYTATIKADSADQLRIYNNVATSMLIDEIRLHPAGATFETYTNVPLSGVGSKSDNSNYITYYEYDQFGVLVLTRDMRGNILSKLEEFALDPDTGATSGDGGGSSGGSGSY